MKYLLCFLLLANCTSSLNEPAMNPNIIYKMDVALQVNQKLGVGAVVAHKADKYVFKVKNTGDLNSFVFTNCHREDTMGIDSREVTYEYTPSSDQEKLYCPVQLGFYGKEDRKLLLGFVDFEHPDYDLVATVKCNGTVVVANGVSVCQSLNGLIQEISFEIPTIVLPSASCPMPAAKDGKTYSFKIATGQCVYRFMEEAKGSDRTHRLTTLGYEKILFREKE